MHLMCAFPHRIHLHVHVWCFIYLFDWFFLFICSLIVHLRFWKKKVHWTRWHLICQYLIAALSGGRGGISPFALIHAPLCTPYLTVTSILMHLFPACCRINFCRANTMSWTPVRVYFFYNCPDQLHQQLLLIFHTATFVTVFFFLLLCWSFHAFTTTDVPTIWICHFASLSDPNILQSFLCCVLDKFIMYFYSFVWS